MGFSPAVLSRALFPWCLLAPLALTIFLPLLQYGHLRLGDRDLMKMFYLGLPVSQSFTLCTLSSCRSLYLFLFTVGGSLLMVTKQGIGL